MPLPWRLALVGLFLVGGCSSVQRPTATYRSMAVSDVTSKGFTLNVDLDVANPNSVALPLNNIDYGLALGGTKVIEQAKANPGATIPANGTGRVTIPVPLSFENLLAASERFKRAAAT